MKLKKIKTFSLILGSIFFLQGCIAAAVVGGAAATKVATDPRTVGTQVDDETLEIRVKNALNNDAQLKQEGRVEVVSYSGRILLIGQVPNDNLKNIATNLAKGAEGVTEVYNEIRMGQPISLMQRSKDSWITTKIKSELLINSKVKTTSVKAITEDGEVFLMGNLTQEQSDAASEVARNISGVKKVVRVFNYIQ